jgi:EAL domain-containing protein (putative c-di-GMP-specific phosphodiesterase class I)
VPLGGGAILAAVTNLAHVLLLPVTAEGVETRHQHDQVSAIGCELAQGFYFAHPMPAAAIDQLLGTNGDGARRLPVPAEPADAAATAS